MRNDNKCGGPTNYLSTRRGAPFTRFAARFLAAAAFGLEWARGARLDLADHC